MEASFRHQLHPRNCSGVGPAGIADRGTNKSRLTRADILSAGTGGLSRQAIFLFEIPNDGRQRGHYGASRTFRAVDEFRSPNDKVG